MRLLEEKGSGGEGKFGLIGFPVSHSLSPAIFAAAFRAAGIRARYELYTVPPEDLERDVTRLVAEGILGFNITLPHKTAVIPMMAKLDDSALLTGAVNTVQVTADGMVGYNTDMGGIEDSFEPLGVPSLSGCEALVLGAGGAARAVVAALCRAGAVKVVIANRFIEETMDLLSALAPSFTHVTYEAIGLEPAELRRQSRDAAICVQATSLGLHPDDPLPMDPALLPRGCFVYDVVYQTGVTPFVRSALDHGYRAADGKELLLRQAARNYILWLGQEAPFDAMRDGMEKEMKTRQGQGPGPVA